MADKFAICLGDDERGYVFHDTVASSQPEAWEKFIMMAGGFVGNLTGYLQAHGWDPTNPKAYDFRCKPVTIQQVNDAG